MVPGLGHNLNKFWKLRSLWVGPRAKTLKWFSTSRTRIKRFKKFSDWKLLVAARIPGCLPLRALWSVRFGHCLLLLPNSHLSHQTAKRENTHRNHMAPMVNSTKSYFNQTLLLGSSPIRTLTGRSDASPLFTGIAWLYWQTCCGCGASNYGSLNSWAQTWYSPIVATFPRMSYCLFIQNLVLVTM